MSYTDKIFLDANLLRDELQRRRRHGGKVIFANGCFELIHVGHVRYLYASKELGDVLVVAVNTEFDRYEIIASIGAVDYVVPLDELTPAELLELLKPDIQTKGTDYTLDRIPERTVVEAYGGRVEIVGDPKTHSTTDMRNHIQRK